MRTYRVPADVFLKNNYGNRAMAIMEEDRVCDEVVFQHLYNKEYGRIGLMFAGPDGSVDDCIAAVEKVLEALKEAKK